MAKTRKKKSAKTINVGPDPTLIAALDREDSIAGVPGPGRWLVLEYQPTSLFSLKTSQATSSVGVTLVIPTPYAIKMAFVDAAFRFGMSDDECDKFLTMLANVDVRISPARASIVTHTFVKVRQDMRPPDRGKGQTDEEYLESLIQKLCSAHPGFDPVECRSLDVDTARRFIAVVYDSSIAYREIVYLDGIWRWAFDLAAGEDGLAEWLIQVAPHVGYIGKRGSFVQLVKPPYRAKEIGSAFTQPIRNGNPWPFPQRSHVRQLDDFGPEANLQVLSSFASKKPKQETHRRFVPTIIPVGIVNTGPGFSEYHSE